MTFFDVAIIYMAFGAPFGVYGLTAVSPRPLGSRVARFGPRFLAWPAVVVRFAYRQWLAAKNHIDSGRKIEAIRREIEELAFVDSPVADVFEFREIFYRYAGLSTASAAPTGAGHIRDLAGIGVLKNAKLAASCTARKNREKITSHHEAARDDLCRLISNIVVSEPELLTRAVELAILVSDPIAVERLSALAGRAQTPSVRSSRHRALAA